MKTKMKHTATPWTTGNGNSREIWAYKKDLNDTLIATCEGIGNLKTDEQRANAAFIVQAVNAHKELVELVKMFRSDILMSGREPHSNLMKRIEKAIDEAETRHE